MIIQTGISVDELSTLEMKGSNQDSNHLLSCGARGNLNVFIVKRDIDKLFDEFKVK